MVRYLVPGGEKQSPTGNSSLTGDESSERRTTRGIGEGMFSSSSSSSSLFSYFSPNRLPTTNFGGTAHRSADGSVRTALYGALPLSKENLDL
ncbi:hypothetical protein B296_00054830 [Ensete ventricosum]|uniref:Uncharacterized protein n=1 Tax=Ensete ventricosum TaxID=4639 RepID=A0A426Y298_ENSVE|nr:hypothetical protein B296_00054830 [Ensete ventricosum]